MAVAINAPKTPVTTGSNGLAAATLPNVCKMPGPPAPFVPTPLPNIGKSGDSPQGYSTSVTIEDDPVAIKGATFNSMGDVPSQGTGGGLVSNNVQGATSFLGPGSPTVAIEGKAVQLLSDQTLNNCGPSGSPANAGTTALMQPPGVPVIVEGVNLTEIAKKCNEEVNKGAGYPDPKKPSGSKCTRLGTLKHTCCKKAVDSANSENVKAEQPFLKNGTPTKYPGEIRPDVVVLGAGGKVSQVFDFKFNCSSKGKMSKPQGKNYMKAFGVEPQIIHAR